MRIVENLVLCFLSFMIVSCGDEKKVGNIIDISGQIEEEEKQQIGLDAIVDKYRVVPIDSASFLINSHHIGDVTEKYIVLSNSHMVCFFNRQTGYAEFVIDKQGRGAGEYVSIGSLIVDPETNSIYILDAVAEKVIRYSYTGEVIREISGLRDIVDLKSSDNGMFIASYKPEIPYMIGVYDSAFILQRQFLKRGQKLPEGKGMFLYNEIEKHNGKLYFQPEECDTVYSVSKESIKYGFTIKMEHLRIPFAVMTDLGRKAERMNYIWGEHGTLVDDLYFTTYYYANKQYQDIWDISQSNLLYRNIMSKEDMSSPGIEIELEGNKLNVWPSFAIKGYMYCLVNGVIANQIFPQQFTEDSNGFILEFKMK